MSIGPVHRHTGLILATLALAQLIFSLDINIVFVALPDISSHLGFTDQTQQWVIGAYTVFSGGFLLLGGRAADLLGRRRTFITALSVYGVSSLAGGLASTTSVIIVARAVQGIGGALLLPATLSLISTLFEEGPKRNRALAVWGGAGASGLTVGALLGGILTQNLGWPAVFFVNVPLAAVAITGALVYIPADTSARSRRRFDLPGALTVTGGATLLVFGLVEGPVNGWGSASDITAFVLAAALLAAFAVIETRSSDPLMPPALLGNRSLVVAVTITFLYMASFGTLPYFLTNLLQGVHGMDALQTGLAFLVPSVAIATGTQLGERLSNRIGARTALIAGLLVGAVGTAVMTLGFHHHSGYAALLPGLVVSGLGQGVVWTAMWIAAATGVSPQEQGVANGMATTTLSLGNAIGLAVLVAVAGRNTGGLTGGSLADAQARGYGNAVWITVVIMAVGAALALALKPRAAVEPVARPVGSTAAHPANAGRK
ncbi:MFS transporter [Actinacidiphila guanduensis]|uniref:Drug resistance transporter, EmrB/QacA subfamily n=1 Tax=Actinacidiphila guanduensis TaxID=310781 RepID=A0A1G9Z6I9_9ACTN|nr:MFS transporter [Actinacidiphila guanduensis]SDN17198.1 drug resistance transporter, EmrB/QacA subfamily [Actinacidiphila guanduensis]